MTQEEKQLLLVDLCGRLPYGVKGKTLGSKVCTLRHIGIDGDFTAGLYHGWLRGGQFIPYLRSMSSMTEEEQLELSVVPIYARMLDNASAQIDWLNAHHFDYRGLIPKGLAIEVTEDNNPYKD